MGLIRDTINIINNIHIPVGGLGIMRQMMPQINDNKMKQFLFYLDENKIGYKRKKIPVSDLRLSQGEINKTKVFKMMNLIRKKNKFPDIIVSGDRHPYVMDGSHRAVAYMNSTDKKFDKIGALVIDLPALELIKMMNNFPGVEHRSFSGTKLD